MIPELKDKILSIRPEYSNNSNSMNPLPYDITLYYQEDDYLIDFNLDVNDVLNAEVLKDEEDYQLTDSDVNFIYKYLKGLLDEETRLTKQYYQAEGDQQQQTYFIR
jgi:hypothetical protein